MENKLNFQETLVNGCKNGLANALNLILMVALYFITVWIPYLNIATTIGLYKAVIALSKGEPVAPMSIFDSANFKHLSDFFLLFGIYTVGIAAAAAFMFVPAIVLAIAWGYVFYFLIDKEVSPLKALKLSFDVTRGEKWTIFFVQFVAVFAVTLIISLVATILGTFLPEGLVGVLTLILTIVSVPIFIGIEAELYKHFSSKADAQ